MDQRTRTLRRLGKAVAEIRGERGFSQEELAERSGLHRTYIGAVERAERNPTSLSLVALGRGLGCGITGLIERAFG